MLAAWLYRFAGSSPAGTTSLSGLLAGTDFGEVGGRVLPAR
jgi:hypothetical protein